MIRVRIASLSIASLRRSLKAKCRKDTVVGEKRFTGRAKTSLFKTPMSHRNYISRNRNSPNNVTQFKMVRRRKWGDIIPQLRHSKNKNIGETIRRRRRSVAEFTQMNDKTKCSSITMGPHDRQPWHQVRSMSIDWLINGSLGFLIARAKQTIRAKIMNLTQPQSTHPSFKKNASAVANNCNERSEMGRSVLVIIIFGWAI